MIPQCRQFLVKIRLEFSSCMLVAREQHVRFFAKIKKSYAEKFSSCIDMTLADLWTVIMNVGQDISRGFRTEIDFINSTIVNEWRERGIPTPINTITGDKIRLRESRITSGEHS